MLGGMGWAAKPGLHRGLRCLVVCWDWLPSLGWGGLFRVGWAAQNSLVEPWDEVGYAGWGMLGCPWIPGWVGLGCSRLPRRAQSSPGLPGMRWGMLGGMGWDA